MGRHVLSLPRDLEIALSHGLTKALEELYAALKKANPKKTGRMAASWFVGVNGVNTGYVAPALPIVFDPGPLNKQFSIFDDHVFINNVPYAEEIIDDYSGIKAPPDWYYRTMGTLPFIIGRSFRQEDLSRVGAAYSGFLGR